MVTSRSALGYGSDLSSTVSTTLKIALLAPMPSARVRTTTAVKADCRAGGEARNADRCGGYPWTCPRGIAGRCLPYYGVTRVLFRDGDLVVLSDGGHTFTS